MNDCTAGSPSAKEERTADPAASLNQGRVIRARGWKKISLSFQKLVAFAFRSVRIVPFVAEIDPVQNVDLTRIPFAVRALPGRSNMFFRRGFHEKPTPSASSRQRPGT